MPKSSAEARSKKNAFQSLSSTTKALIKFIGFIFLLIIVGLVYHFNTDQSIESTQKFFEQRKQFQEYHEYKKDEDSAKKKAERNIFLQD